MMCQRDRDANDEQKEKVDGEDRETGEIGLRIHSLVRNQSHIGDKIDRKILIDQESPYNLGRTSWFINQAPKKILVTNKKRFWVIQLVALPQR